MRILALYCAICIYAIFSSPTPDTFGLWEGIVVALILVSLSPIQGMRTFMQPQRNSWLFYRTFFILMLLLPLMIGALYSHSLHDMLRDMLPFLCLALPFFMKDKNLGALPLILMLAGFAFALRYIVLGLPQIMHIGTVSGQDNLLYLANSPLVIFACLYGAQIAFKPTRMLITHRLIGMTITVITLVAMAFMIQRAPLILSLCGLILIISHSFVKTPIKISVFVALLFTLSIPYWPYIHDIAGGSMTKTFTVGSNSRIEEFKAVFAHTPLWGLGWGAVWQSPAVGDYWVRYTHNMISYYMLKAGIIGAALSLGLIYVMLARTIRIMRHDFAIGLALFVPLSIHMTLYTGYKTLDFALLITLTLTWIKDPLLSSFSIVHFRQSLARQDD